MCELKNVFVVVLSPLANCWFVMTMQNYNGSNWRCYKCQDNF